MLSITACFNSNSFGQYFTKFVHSTLLYPNTGVDASCKTGLQLTGTTKGMVSIGNSDVGFAFHSINPDGSTALSNNTAPCAVSPNNFLSSAFVTFWSSSIGGNQYNPHAEDIVEVDPALGVMALVGNVDINNKKSAFVTLIDPYGKIYSTLTLDDAINQNKIFAKAVCYDATNSHLYIAGYIENSANNKSLMVIKLTYQGVSSPPHLQLNWMHKYDITGGGPLTNPIGEDIIFSKTNQIEVLSVVGYANHRSGDHRGGYLEIDPNAPNAPVLGSYALVDRSQLNKLAKSQSSPDDVFIAGHVLSDGSGITPAFGKVMIGNNPTINKYDPTNPQYGARRNVKSLLLSNNGYAYLFGDVFPFGIVQPNDAYLLPIDYSTMLASNEIRFSDRMNNTTDFWSATEISEDVDNAYITLHGSYNGTPGLTQNSMVIDNIYHNGTRSPSCGNKELTSLFQEEEVQVMEVEFESIFIKLTEGAICEGIDVIFSTLYCFSTDAPDGGPSPDPIMSPIVRTNLLEVKSNKFSPTVSPNPFKADLLLQHVQAGKMVRVFSITGKELMAIEVKQDGAVTLTELNALATGVYFIRIDDTTIKVVKE